MVQPSDGLAVLFDTYKVHDKYLVPYEAIHKLSLIAGNPHSDVYEATLEHDGVEYRVASKELRVCSKSADKSNVYKVCVVKLAIIHG